MCETEHYEIYALLKNGKKKRVWRVDLLSLKIMIDKDKRKVIQPASDPSAYDEWIPLNEVTRMWINTITKDNLK